MAECVHEHEHHHHEHAHEKTLVFGAAAVELSSHMHEQAATVSAIIKIAEGQTLVFAQVVEAMGAIANQAEAAGGIIGHIKGFAESSEGLVHASCTDAALGINVQGDPECALNSKANVQLVAIVMLVGLDALERIVATALAALRSPNRD